MCPIIRSRLSLFCFLGVFFFLFGLESAFTDLTVENVGSFGGWPDCVVVQGNHAFRAQGRMISVFDVSGGEMVRVASVTVDVEPNNKVLHGNHINTFARWNDTGMQIIDISNPLEPTVAGTMNLETGIRARGFVAGNYAYKENGWQITIKEVPIVDNELYLRGLKYLYCIAEE